MYRIKYLGGPCDGKAQTRADLPVEIHIARVGDVTRPPNSTVDTAEDFCQAWEKARAGAAVPSEHRLATYLRDSAPDGQGVSIYRFVEEVTSVFAP